MAEIAPCDDEIYYNGRVVGIYEAGASEMESVIQQVRSETGLRVDWHYAAGRAIVKTLDDPDKVLESLDKIMSTREPT